MSDPMTDPTDPIATYIFVPCVRQGLASKIQVKPPPENGVRNRATVQLALEMQADGKVVISDNSPDFVRKTVHLIGPGDVIGISPRAIVRTEPRNWVTDFESNYLPFIEFYEEDFPWRFTPTVEEKDPQERETRLLPWIFLMVLADGEFNDIPPVSGLLPAIELTVDPESVLPDADQAWAWAHVHVSKDIPNLETLSTDFAELMRQNPDHAVSRLLSPRKLLPSTGYHAFLIPSFEVGRLAGLGRPTDKTDMLIPSWGITADQTEFPVYYRWYFRTGERGDFEYLVSLLKPRKVDEKVGIRDMDLQAPNFGVRGITTGEKEHRVVGLEGALRRPDAISRPEDWPPRVPATNDIQERYKPFLSDLEKMVNLQEELQSVETPDPPETLLNQPDPTASHPDPIISPPLYGRWHAIQHTMKVGQKGWVHELNQDPRLRVPAGFGTKVIQAGQEDYMQRAWQQLGDLVRANHKIRQLQVAIAASLQMYVKHIKSLDTTDPVQSFRIISLVRQMHSRVIRNGTTIYQELRESKVESAVKPAFRRILRPGGPIMRKAFRQRPAGISDALEKLNAGKITAAAPKKRPTRPLFLQNLDIAVLREDRLMDRLEPNEGFEITLPDVAAPVTAAAATAGTNFQTTLNDLHIRLKTPTANRAERTTADSQQIKDTLVTALNPKNTILQRARSLIYVPETVPSPPTETIVPVMAHPVFADPMYKPLRDLSSELLLPNLNLIPNNTITLMETNPKFIESYMVGLNHEMSRELLWREYPTDQRGSYFRQFWDVSDIVKPDGMDAKDFEESLRDIKPIHEWQPSDPLGDNAPENRALPKGRKLDPDDEEPDLVLVIRGDLLKRYPTAIIFAQQGMWAPEQLATEPPTTVQIRKLDPEGPIREPVFKAQIEPDLYFMGFKLKELEAKGSEKPEDNKPGWFFVIQERPGEPRFGMDLNVDNKDLEDRDKLYVWNNLKWEHLIQDGNPVSVIDANIAPSAAIVDRGPETLQEELVEDDHNRDINILWGSNSADMAYILFQAPVMVAIHASNMLPPKK